MNKEEKKYMENLGDALEAMAKRLGNENNMIPPILFMADCDHCGKTTTQVSHIARDKPPYGIPTTQLSYAAKGGEAPVDAINLQRILNAKPIRTCLICGKIYRET